MKVKEKIGAFTKGEMFNLSKGVGCTLMKKVADATEFDVTGYIIMTDEQVNPETGETKEKDILHIRCADGQVLTTESPTIIRTLCDAVEFMETCELKFKLIRATSKNGRQFMDLELLTEGE